VPLADAVRALASGVSADNSPSQVIPLIHTSFNEAGGELSPDERYLAYQSDESGRFEIYVRTFPDINAGRWQISTDGGSAPVWAHNGNELFYLDRDGILTAVPTRLRGSSLVAGAPARILTKKYAVPRGLVRSYDVSRDDRRFLMQKDANGDPRATQARMIVVTNWSQELEQRMSAR
jgi:serine/threonine-protein kinase